MSSSELALKTQNCPNKLLERLFSGKRADWTRKTSPSLPLAYVTTIQQLVFFICKMCVTNTLPISWDNYKNVSKILY